ncbi:MAG: DNA polymerase IV [Parachlamydiaceae bacterium]|nr:DNA polymerase IV [Parachlamydiaceae bacterium]
MNKKARCVFHIDMDAFFASIEISRNPFLKGKPVIVGGRPDQRGVVSTCSYEARSFGVRSAMPLSEAKRLCPHGIFLEGSYSLYREYSERVFAIFYQYTPLVEVVSIDEAYLDVSLIVDNFDSPVALANLMRQQVLAETLLTCSIGIATNKLISKIAASRAKPNGVYEVLPDTEAYFLAPLPIQNLSGVGAKTQAILNREGIHFIADLQAIPLETLIDQYGSWGYHYFLSCQGKDNRPVDCEEYLPKSIGAETTFERDHNDPIVLEEELINLANRVHNRLRAHKMRCRRISLKIRFSDFKTISRSQTLSSHINSINIINKEILKLFKSHYNGWPALRLIGISLEQLTDTYWQPSLFPEEDI